MGLALMTVFAVTTGLAAVATTGLAAVVTIGLAAVATIGFAADATTVFAAVATMGLATGAATGFAAITGLGVTFARACVRLMLRTFVVKHFSSARSTCSSTSSAFCRITSETSEMMSALARSSIRFSRNDRLFDLLRKVRLLRTSAMS